MLINIRVSLEYQKSEKNGKKNHQLPFNTGKSYAKLDAGNTHGCMPKHMGYHVDLCQCEYNLIPRMFPASFFTILHND